MGKREKLVKAIGDKVIEELFKLENEFQYEGDEQGFYKASYRVLFEFVYGNGRCEVDCSVWLHHERKKESFECLLYGSDGKKEKSCKSLDRIEDAVNAYLDEHLDMYDLRKAMEDDMVEAAMDEYQRNGFAGEADYMRWRYA